VVLVDKQEIQELIKNYGINDYDEKKEIDTSNGDDYRLNIILDKKYVLRINGDAITEDRLASIDRLAERYREMGLLAPKLYKTGAGKYISKYNQYVCYISEYIDLPSLEEKEDELDLDTVYKEIRSSIGEFAGRFTGVDLSDVNSMWSLIDLAPLDVDRDEKQENLDMLEEELRKIHEDSLADEVVAFNNEVRERIKKVYKKLPRCVIQGDLNGSNILVKDGHFVGLIDFNMAGTEVNVNQFCCETNDGIPEEDFDTKSADQLYNEWIKRQEEGLNSILSRYEMNDIEKSVIEDYRRIGRISQYPTVMDFISFMKKDKEKTIDIIKRIVRDKYPSREEAERLLKEAEGCNPGPWGNCPRSSYA
jgi:Ser/Thr protein kinase RdoA (MazF antagonist)